MQKTSSNNACISLSVCFIILSSYSLGRPPIKIGAIIVCARGYTSVLFSIFSLCVPAGEESGAHFPSLNPLRLVLWQHDLNVAAAWDQKYTDNYFISARRWAS